jgi:hypothetical protein
MAIVAVGSVGGSPGVTTLTVALGAVWPRPVVVVEADPDGGTLAARYELAVDPGLTGLAGRARRGLDAASVDAALQAMPGGARVLLADPGAEATSTALAVGGAAIARGLALLDADAVVDVGRLRPGTPAQPLIDAAAVVLVVVRPTADALARVARRLAVTDVRHDVVLVGERPYSAKDVERALGRTVLGVVADDGRTAAGLRGGPFGGRRRPSLLDSTRPLAERLVTRLGAEASSPWWREEPAEASA